MERKLDFGATLGDAFRTGFQNILNLLLTILLYGITLWIPYLNIATTIGLYRIIIALAHEETFSPTDIFKKENFQPIGDFFLLLGFQTAGIGAAAFFLFFPAMVLSIAWQYSTYFLLDRGVSPLRALKLSFDVTRGEKWSIFFIGLVYGFCICLVCGLLFAIPKVGPFLGGIAYFVALPLFISLQAVLYRYFFDKAVEMTA